MKLKNINGTSQNTCSCSSWLKHWEKHSGQTTVYCGEEKCINRDLVGAHVQKADSIDAKWYIVPLCNAHNKSSGTLNVADYLKLVSANKSETCEKRK